MSATEIPPIKIPHDPELEAALAPPTGTDAETLERLERLEQRARSDEESRANQTLTLFLGLVIVAAAIHGIDVQRRDDAGR